MWKEKRRKANIKADDNPIFWYDMNYFSEGDWGTILFTWMESRWPLRTVTSLHSWPSPLWSMLLSFVSARKIAKEHLCYQCLLVYIQTTCAGPGLNQWSVTTAFDGPLAVGICLYQTVGQLKIRNHSIDKQGKELMVEKMVNLSSTDNSLSYKNPLDESF